MSAQEYCEREGLTLDDHVYKDLGVSGFKGRNAKEGALKEFMEAVEAGAIKAGSLLLIEDMDRLTRLPVLEGLAVFQRILAGGITLVTLKNGNKYSTESLNKDWTQLMPILFDMSRGWGESERKSYLLGKAWRKKKQEAAEKLKPLGNNAPLWLQCVYNEQTKEQEYREVRKNADAVRRMFELALNGYGFSSIAIMLEEEGFKRFKPKEGKSPMWGTTTISRTLHNRAVIGEYQPLEGSGYKHTRAKAGPPIPGFFPPIVDKDTFDRVQEAIKSRKIHRTTKQAPMLNLWQGVGLCGKCSGAMHINKKGKGLNYLICANKWSKVCDSRIVRLEPSERVFAEILALTGNTSLVADDTAQKEAKLQAVKGRLIDEQSKYQSLMEVLNSAPSLAVGQMVASQEAKVTATREEIIELEAALAASTVIDRGTFFKNLDLTKREVRGQANALMKRLGIKVTMTKPNRYGIVNYSVYQQDVWLMDLSELDGKIDVPRHGPKVTLRLHSQKQIEDHQLEANIAWGSKKRLSTRLNKPVRPVEDTSNTPDWGSYDGPFYDNDYPDENTPTDS
ncbi:hypothetical protein GCM10025794_00860 [Massilia kyonggiensis]